MVQLDRRTQEERICRGCLTSLICRVIFKTDLACIRQSLVNPSSKETLESDNRYQARTVQTVLQRGPTDRLPSSHSLVFYHVQTECGCEQNICSTDDDLDRVQSQSSVLSLSTHSLVFYHVQTVCGCEQNICSTDDDHYSVQLNADVNKYMCSTADDLDSVHSQLYADENRTSARQMMTSTVSSHSLVFYHVQTECGCEQIYVLD
ncbi:hypothetical protein J6590_092243 [Homalodisca vitripennis]|nr:hypothetical protein J6590_092243 [Homalodisca vitripennis]